MLMAGAQTSEMQWTGILYAKKLENAAVRPDRKFLIAGVDRFRARAPAPGTIISGSFTKNALMLTVGNVNAGANIAFTHNAVKNAVAANPGGAVQELAKTGARFAFTDSTRVGGVLRELGVNALPGKIEILKSRIAHDAETPAARNRDLSALAQGAQAPAALPMIPERPALLLPLMDGTASGGKPPPTGESATARPGAGTTLFADSAAQAAESASPISDSDVLQAIGGVIAMFSGFFAAGMNRQDQGEAQGGTHRASLDYTARVNAQGALYQDENVAVTAEAGVEAGASASAQVVVSDGAFEASAKGFAGVRAEAAVTAEARLNDDVSATSTTTVSAQAGVSGEGRASGALKEDVVSGAAYGGVSAGAEAGVTQTNTVEAGDSSLTTTTGVSAGLSVGASGGGEIAITDQSITLGLTMDVDLGLGVTLGFKTTVDYDDVTQGLETGYGAIAKTGTGALAWANTGWETITASNKDDDDDPWWKF